MATSKLLDIDITSKTQYYWRYITKVYNLKICISEINIKMHDFKIVATKERNGVYYCAVPHLWEQDQTLRWPEHLNYSSRESLRSDPANAPEDSWAEYPCILKCSGIAKFKEALQLEKQLSGCVDTDAEEALFHSMMEKRQKRKRVTELTDRNDLFENVTFHREHNVDKSQEEKKIKIISQEIITPITDKQDLFTRNNNAMPKALVNTNNNSVPQFSTLLVHEDGSVTSYNLEDDCINPTQQQQSVEIQQIKLEITNIKTEIVGIKEEIKQDFHKINVNLDRIYKVLAELNVPTSSTEIDHIQKEDLLQEFNFPLSSCEEIQRLENTIRSNEEFKTQLISFLSKTGGTTREEDGVKVAYKVVDQVFSPNVLINYTWTGVSRGNKATKKKSFQILEGILNVFFEVLSLADNRHTKQRNCHIFKDCILKYATKRSLRKRSKRCDNTDNSEQPATSNEKDDDILREENDHALKDDADDSTLNEADGEDSD